MTDNNGDIGVVKVANDVVVAYIYDAVINTEGVAGLSSGGFGDAISQTFLGKESKYKGIKIDSSEKGYTVDIYIIIEFGSKIPVVAWAIQKNVKKDLEDIMFLDIESINIHVQEVRKTDGSGESSKKLAKDEEVFDAIQELGKEEQV